MATIIVAITEDSTQTAASLAARVVRNNNSTQRQSVCLALARELEAIAGGTRRASVTLLVETADSTKASATVTLGGAALTANDTLTIGGVTLTWKVAASSESEVTIGGSTAASLANLTAKINAHSDLDGMVTATDNGATVLTITAAIAGNLGRLGVVKTESNANAMVLSAASLGGITSAIQVGPRTYSLGV